MGKIQKLNHCQLIPLTTREAVGPRACLVINTTLSPPLKSKLCFPLFCSELILHCEVVIECINILLGGLSL